MPESAPAPLPVQGQSTGPVRYQSFDGLDEITRTTRPRGWLALAAIAVLVAAFTAWACIATVPRQVGGNGVIAVSRLVTDVIAPSAGALSWGTQVGTPVQQGQSIGVVRDFTGQTSSIQVPSEGTLESWSTANGAGVSQGASVATVTRRPASAEDVVIALYLGPAGASAYDVGNQPLVIITDYVTGRTSTTTATVTSVAEVPSTAAEVTAMVGSPLLAQRLINETGGSPYRVLLTADQLSPQQLASLQGGQVVQVVLTVDNPHPISLVFGGQS